MKYLGDYHLLQYFSEATIIFYNIYKYEELCYTGRISKL